MEPHESGGDFVCDASTRRSGCAGRTGDCAGSRPRGFRRATAGSAGRATNEAAGTCGGIRELSDSDSTGTARSGRRDAGAAYRVGDRAGAASRVRGGRGLCARGDSRRRYFAGDTETGRVERAQYSGRDGRVGRNARRDRGVQSECWDDVCDPCDPKCIASA